MKSDLVARTCSVGMIILLMASSIVIFHPSGASQHLREIGVLTSTGQDGFASFVEHIPDITGDGLSELLVGEPHNDTAGANAGHAYIFFSPLDGKDADNTNADITISGTKASQNFGSSGTYLPDVFTADGGGEIAIGAPGNDSHNGAVFIFELGDLLLGGSFDTGAAAYTIDGARTEVFGHSVSRAGDYDHDGTQDLLVGAPEGKGENFASDGNRSGRAYVFLGGGTPPGADSAAADVTILGYAGGDKLGFAVSYAGDVNADNVDDIAIGAPGNRSSGQVLLFFGGAGMATQGANDANVTVFEGTADTELGYSVNATGDHNGDGLDDVIMGGPGYNGARGRAYIVFGNETIGDVDLGVPSEVFIAFTANDIGRLGHSVSGLRDMDGDGFDDCIAGAPLVNNSMGYAYTFFGNGSFPNTMIPAADANFSNNGSAQGDMFGFWVSEGGKANRDEHPDAFVGSPNASGGKGKARVFKIDHLPVLTVPGAVTPFRGNATTPFTYRVIYTDAENDPPAVTHPKVRIFKDLDGTVLNATTPNAMISDPEAPAVLRDGDYTNGEQYMFTTILGSQWQYNYLFEASAGIGLDDIVRTDLQANATTGPVPIVDATPPGGLTNVTVGDTPLDHGGSIDVAWDRTDEEDFAAYEIYIDDEPFQHVRNRRPATIIDDRETTENRITTFEGAPLTDYTEHWVGVGARDDMGNRIIALPGMKVVPRDNFNLLPGAVADLGAQSGNDEGLIELTWTAAGDDGMTKGPVSEYVLRYTTTDEINSPNDWNSSIPIVINVTPLDPGKAMETTLSGLAVGVEHYFAMRSRDGVGQISNISNSPSAFPGIEPDITAPNAVTGVELYDIPGDSTNMGLIWKPDISIDFDHYNIYVSTHTFIEITESGVFLENDTISEKATNKATISTIDGASLTFGKTYYAAITAVDSSGNERENVICSYGQLHKDDFDVTPPHAVTGLTAADTDNDRGGSITVSWDRCEAVDFLHYRVFASTEMITELSSQKVKLVHTEYERDNISTVFDRYDGAPPVNGRNYHIAVVAQDFNGQVSPLENSSLFGPVESVDDGDVDTPPPVAGFGKEEMGTDHAVLKWTPFLKDDLPDFHQYVIFRSMDSPVDPSDATRIDGSNSPSLLSIGTRRAEVTGLKKETTYYFVIICQDDRMGKENDLSGNISKEITVITASPNSLPVLSEHSVESDGMTEGREFTFKVMVRDTDSSPDHVRVVINNESHDMTLVSGNHSAGAYYSFTVKLPRGTYEYHFEVLDSYFKGDVSRVTSYPSAPASITVTGKGDGGKEGGMGAVMIVIVIVVIILVAAGAGLLLMLLKKKKDKTVPVAQEEDEKKDVETWTCACGEVTIPVTETAHCGFCGEYHEPLDPLAEIPETHTEYPDYSSSDLYGSTSSDESEAGAATEEAEPKADGTGDSTGPTAEESAPTVPEQQVKAEQQAQVAQPATQSIQPVQVSQPVTTAQPTRSVQPAQASQPATISQPTRPQQAVPSVQPATRSVQPAQVSQPATISQPTQPQQSVPSAQPATRSVQPAQVSQPATISQPTQPQQSVPSAQPATRSVQPAQVSQPAATAQPIQSQQAVPPAQPQTESVQPTQVSQPVTTAQPTRQQQ